MGKEKCYKATRDDGLDLGTFDRESEAMEAAEKDARANGHRLTWGDPTFGAVQGSATERGRGVHNYSVSDVPCE